MPPKKAAAAAGPVRMCGARKCGSTNSNTPAGIPKVYKSAQCQRACAEGSNLCTLCQKQETAYLGGKKGMWHGRFDAANIPAESHIKGSEWYAAAVAKLAAKEAKAAGASAAAVPAPDVKAAAKEAERAAKEAAAMQKRIATQAAAFEREQAAYLAGIGRMVNAEMKSAAAAEKAAAKAAAAAARVTKKATSARKPAAAAARRTSSARRSSAAKRAPATIYVPASAAAAAARSDETLGSLALSSNNSSNLRWYAANPVQPLPAGIPGPRASSAQHQNPMLPAALYHAPRSTSSSRRSTQRHVSSSSGHRSTARRSSSSHRSAAAPAHRSSSSHSVAAAAPARSSSSHSASRAAAAAPVVQTNGAGANMMIDDEAMKALLEEMGEMGGVNLM